MAISLLTGKISHLDHATETSGNITANHGGQIQTAHAWAFRLNNRPVIYKSHSTASFAEGDELTAAGVEQNGTFKIISYRNETTGAVHQAPGLVVCIAAGLLIAMSLPMMMVIVGFLMLPIGIYILMWGLRIFKANKLLETAPRTAAVPA